MKVTYQLNEIEKIAKRVIKETNSKILLFNGEMGVGKTTLIKEIVKELGVKENTSSPTFSLVNQYQGTKDTIYHFDFYRIDNEEEALDMGIEDYFYSNSWCLIEWPEKIPNLIPEEAIEIRITKDDNENRLLEIIS